MGKLQKGGTGLRQEGGCGTIRRIMPTGINHSERRRMVVSRAMHLFARMGYAKVSFLTISEATGIARTALYRYFKTKREIFDEAIRGITSAIRLELDRISARKDVPVARRIVQSCDLVIDELYGKRDFFSAIYEFVFAMVRTGEDMSSRIDSFTVGFKVVLRNLVAEGVANGELRRGVDPDDAAEALFALMESVAFRLLLGVEKEPNRAKERFGTMIAALHD